MESSTTESRLITAPNLLYLPLDHALETTLLEEDDDEFIELVTKHRMATYERRKILENEFQKREIVRSNVLFFFHIEIEMSGYSLSLWLSLFLFLSDTFIFTFIPICSSFDAYLIRKRTRKRCIHF